MRLPSKKKAGDPVLATDWNLLLDAIMERTPRSGAGLRLTSGSSGFAYSAPPPSGDLMRGFPPFSVLGIEKTDTGFNVAIREGYVIERIAKEDDDAPDVVYFHSVTFGGSNLEDIPRPLIPMKLGETLWATYKTDAQGIITGTPELIVGGDTQESTHYIPVKPDVNDDTGTEGKYFVKLFKLDDDDGTPMVTAWQQSDIEHWAHLWTAKYTGEGQAVYKGFDGDKGVHIFRRIDGRGYWHEDAHDDGIAQQIQVVKDTTSNAPEETIRVIGNGRVGSLVWKDCDGNEVMRLEWNDGLITSSGDYEMEAGCDGWSSYYNF